MKFLLDYSTKPLQLFGVAGLFCLSGGFGIGLWVFIRKALLNEGLMENHGPLLLLGMALVMGGIQFISIGLIGELLARTYYESQNKPVYNVRELRGPPGQQRGTTRSSPGSRRGRPLACRAKARAVADARDLSTEIASPPVRPVRRVFGFLVRLAIAGALLAYLAKSGMIDARALSRPFTAWPVALVAVALILVDVSLMALRLSWLFGPIGLRLPWAKSFQVTLVSFFFAQFLPGATGGDLARLFYVAKDYKGRRSEILTVSLFDRAVGMLSLLVMPLLVAPAFSGLIRSTPVLRDLLVCATVLAALLVAGFLICVYRQSFTERLAHAVFGFLPWKDWYEQIIRTIASYRHHIGTVAAALGISIVANSLLMIVMALAVFVLNPAGLDAKISLVVPLGFIANCLPFTPGGLGIGEEAFNALFAIAGLAGGAEALLCWRVWTSLVRLLGLVFYLRGIERVFGHHSGANPHSAPAARL